TCMEPGWDDAVGNHQFTVYVEDSDTRADRFWLKTFDKDGSVVTLSMLEPTSENAIELERGNISAHDGGSRGNGGGPKKS
ncbi:MAG: hypothetical protein OER95_08060, partial [Acidimicrobiia bacterium]|nr:hypothetical protein [Acidimicrobiia bacterium]